MFEGFLQLEFRLASGTTSTRNFDGSYTIRVPRGKSSIEYRVNKAINGFLDNFREYRTTLSVLEQYKFDKESEEFKSLAKFVKHIIKTPLVSLKNEVLSDNEISDKLSELGLTYIKTFKNKRLGGVYLVKNKAGKDLVLKMIFNYNNNLLEIFDKQKAYLENEYECLSDVSPHINICKPIEINLSTDSPYFLIEYIDGVVLSSNAVGKLNLEQRVDICTQMLSAVSSLHTRNIIHGDVHLSNFILGSKNIIKLIDFDASYQLSKEFKPRPGGSPMFLPPERFGSDWQSPVLGSANFSSEVYQLGICFYKLLSGHFPYQEATFSKLREKVLQSEAEVLLETENGEYLPGPIIEFIHKCLSKKDTERYCNASEALSYWEKII